MTKQQFVILTKENFKKVGLLRRTLKMFRLNFLAWAIPEEDFLQECRAFLYARQAEEDSNKTFFNDANNHFRMVAKNYGWRRNDVRSFRSEFLVSEDQDDDRTLCERGTWGSHEEDFLHESMTAVCRDALNGEQWQTFEGYLFGLSRSEIAEKAGSTPGRVAKNFTEAVKKLRDLFGAPNDEPLPALNGRTKRKEAPQFQAGKTRTKQGQHVQVGSADDLSNVPLVELMEKFSVSRATAWRIKKRGWFVADHPAGRLAATEPARTN